MTKPIFPSDGYLFNTHTAIQDNFIRIIHEQGIDTALDWLTTVKNDTERSHPEALTFHWDTDSAESVLEISVSADFSDSIIIKTDRRSHSIDNLLIGTRYYWRVNGGEVRTFETLGSQPRFIKIDGLLNVRDIGGGKIKQGMVYRGSCMDDDFSITDKGIQTFVDELGVRTDFDLRLSSVGVHDSSPAGKNVEYKLLPYRPYEEVFEEQHRNGICSIMAQLADESIYPIYVHCMGGADRTGMIALYLRALMGECDEDIHTDYEITALSTYALGAGENAHGYRRRNAPYYKEFLELMSAYAPGQPLSVQIYNFLLDCGVTEEQIEKIRSILEVKS